MFLQRCHNLFMVIETRIRPRFRLLRLENRRGLQLGTNFNQRCITLQQSLQWTRQTIRAFVPQAPLCCLILPKRLEVATSGCSPVVTWRIFGARCWMGVALTSCDSFCLRKGLSWRCLWPEVLVLPPPQFFQPLSSPKSSFVILRQLSVHLSFSGNGVQTKHLRLHMWSFEVPGTKLEQSVSGAATATRFRWHSAALWSSN